MVASSDDTEKDDDADEATETPGAPEEPEPSGTPEDPDAPEEADDGAPEEAAARQGPGAPAKPPPPPASSEAPLVVPGWWDIIRDVYLTFDRRTLGFSRILLGFLLVMDLFRRTWDWEDMYSTVGVLPNHVNLWRPQASGAFSFFNSFSTPGELWALWFVLLCTFLCVLVGFKTKVAQVLALFFVTSMDGRVLLIENGGYVVYNLLLLWTCFLPMGDRYSVDALLESMRRKRERTDAELNDRSDLVPERKLSPHVTILGIIFLIQLSAIYYFNVLHKWGPLWKNGTAVHYVLYVDRMVTPAIGHVREYIPNWMIFVMTKTTLGFEAAIPVCLLMPIGRAWARRLAIAMINALHLGFGFSMVLGPFAWACCVFSTLAFTSDDWEVANRTMRRAHRARVVVYDRRSGAALWLCRLLARLDRWQLLTFRGEQNVAGVIRVEVPGASIGSTQRVLTGALAAADIVAALPLGPVVAWVLRAPGSRHLADAILGALARRQATRWFGAPPALAEGSRPLVPALEKPPAPARRRWDQVLMVLRELMAAAMFAGAINQALVELWVVRDRIKVPQKEPLRTLAHKLRFLQGWFMFSPGPVIDDGTIVVDAITVDGRHIDPFTREAPMFDIADAKSFAYNQIWCDYFNRMHLPANSAYREAMKEYMYRLPERTGNPNDALVSGDVYWVQDMNPKWNEKKSWKYEKQKLFSFENRKVVPVTNPRAPRTPMVSPSSEESAEPAPPPPPPAQMPEEAERPRLPGNE